MPDTVTSRLGVTRSEAGEVIDGSGGGVVSIVSDRPLDGLELLPAPSSTVAVIVYAPAGRSSLASVQSPAALTTALPRRSASALTVTTVPCSAVPVKVGDVSLVIRSVDDAPESLSGVSATVGAAGAAVSTVHVYVAELGSVSPPTSVARTERVWLPFASPL